jgi:DNA-binding NarL/FixJ family response regulator
LQIARTFKECRGIGIAEIEDLFDITTTRLLSRSFESEDHLRNALRRGIELRALNLYRERVTHSRILKQAASSIQANREEDAWREDPERAFAARQDGVLVAEFLAQLTKSQREIFELIAEGLGWNAIAIELKSTLTPYVPRYAAAITSDGAS